MFNLKDESKLVKITIAVVCGLFLAIGIYTVFSMGNDTLLGSLTEPNNDDVKFIRSGWNIVDLGYYSFHFPENKSAFMMPGLPYVIAAFTYMFGKMNAIVAVRILNVILTTFTMLIVFSLAKKVFKNSKIAMLAFILNALYIPHLWITQLILTESIFRTLTLLLILICLHAVETKKMSYYIMGGITLGIACYFRPQIGLVPVLVLVLWIASKEYTIPEMFKYGSVVVAIVTAIMMPWWIRNYKTFDKFIPFTYATGNPMLQGTYINYDQSVKTTKDVEYGIDHSKFQYGYRDEFVNNTTEMAISKERFGKVLKNEPLRYIKWYTWDKTMHNWSTPFYWREIYGVSNFAMNAYHKILMLAGVGSFILYLFRRGRNMNFWFMAMIVAYFNCVYLPFYAFSRYMYPVVSIMIIMASYLIYSIYDTIKNKHFSIENEGLEEKRGFKIPGRY